MDVPFLVRAGEFGVLLRLQPAGRAVVEAQQVDQVQRGLLLGRPAVLVEQDGYAQQAEVGVQAAGDVLVDPFGGRHVIPAPRPRGGLVKQGRPRRLVVRPVEEQRPGPFVPVTVQRGLGPEPAAEPQPVVQGPGVRRILEHVVQPQPEAGGELAHLGVLAADELPVLLGVLPGVEEPVQGLHAPADAVRVVLVDLAGQAVGGPEPVRTAQARQPGADDHHPRARAGLRPARPGERDRRREGCRPGAAQHLPPGRPRAALGHRLGRLADPAARVAGVGRRGPGPGQEPGRGPARQPGFPAGICPNWNISGTFAHRPTLARRPRPAHTAPAHSAPGVPSHATTVKLRDACN